jgi:hypothetical protein
MKTYMTFNKKNKKAFKLSKKARQEKRAQKIRAIKYYQLQSEMNNSIKRDS